ncbi:PadR family transcriptional regulator [Amnibacterium endophyticum]|uniref:PadR family transcriptional regulator n=1 Tax=Amnibacterium endophyticum TaxID=2109337 RepID=A0ABW4LC27_9MICO
MVDGTSGNSVVERGLQTAREVLDRFRAGADERVVGDAQRDVRGDVLTVLAEQPSNGYRVVRVLADRADGGSAPGAGDVYPVLQLLADEGLATAEELDGRRVWTLTDAGRAAADAARDRAAAGPATGTSTRRGPFDGAGAVAGAGSTARAVAQLGQAAALAAQTGSRDQVAEVVAVIDEARRRIVSILARG